MGSCGSVVTDTITAPYNIINSEKTINKSIIHKNETFLKIKKLGKGNNGEVFLIRSIKTQKEYALKAIIIKNISKKLFEKIMNEVNNLRELDHPNIISFKFAFNSNIKTELLNIITEFADNGDLNDKLNEHIKSNKYFEENELLDWLIQCCLALQYLHEKDIIHRDIKPSNIFLMKNNSIKIGDFGVSKNISTFHRTRTMIGTPLYLAPEIIEQKPYSFEADIWSLGVTFCHLLTLVFPFQGNKEEIIYENIINRNKNPKMLNKEKNNYKEEILKKYSKAFLDLIDELMSQDREKRPTAMEILEKNIIKKRMQSNLYNSNFDETQAKDSIEKYLDNEKEEIKDDFDDKSKKKENIDIIIEEIDNNSILPTKDMNPLKEKKEKYDYLRQMSLMHKSLHRENSKK